jgi:hypothetical protein
MGIRHGSPPAMKAKIMDQNSYREANKENKKHLLFIPLMYYVILISERSDSEHVKLGTLFMFYQAGYCKDETF